MRCGDARSNQQVGAECLPSAPITTGREQPVTFPHNGTESIGVYCACGVGNANAGHLSRRATLWRQRSDYLSRRQCARTVLGDTAAATDTVCPLCSAVIGALCRARVKPPARARQTSERRCSAAIGCCARSLRAQQPIAGGAGSDRHSRSACIAPASVRRALRDQRLTVSASYRLRSRPATRPTIVAGCNLQPVAASRSQLAATA